jgi:toxin YoeB
MELYFSNKAKKDINRLTKESKSLGGKLLELLLNIDETPFSGIGKPEALKGNLSGWWSRRITDEHRLVYRIHDEKIEVASCHGHYEDS